MIDDIVQTVLSFLSSQDRMHFMMINRHYYYEFRVPLLNMTPYEYIVEHTKSNDFLHIAYQTRLFAHNHRITHIELMHYNEPVDYWPTALQSIKIHHMNIPFAQDWPTTLKIIHIVKCPHVLNVPWPASLKHLILGQYNLSLPVWPARLKTLELHSYNEPFQHSWPETLRSIKLVSYDQPLTVPWPINLQQITLIYYDWSIHLPWPKHLEYLKLFMFNQTFQVPFPETLHTLDLYMFNHDIHWQWPAHLCILKMYHFKRKFDHFPSSLHHLELNKWYYMISKQLSNNLQIIKCGEADLLLYCVGQLRDISVKTLRINKEIYQTLTAQSKIEYQHLSVH